MKQKLTVCGSKNDIEAFVATARGAAPATGDKHGTLNHREKLIVEPLCFHLIAPLSDAYARGSYSDVGYHMEADGWSVKWGAYDAAEPVLSTNGTRVTYIFTCAWGPPVKALQRASMRYPSLWFYLSWGGEGPCRGRHTFRAGEICSALQDDWKHNIQPEYPTETEYNVNESAAAAKADAAEQKYILEHDAWVDRMATPGA
ncbi:MAG: hypothetical protein ACTHU0_21905 [Kofleriaceae bacterium]